MSRGRWLSACSARCSGLRAGRRRWRGSKRRSSIWPILLAGEHRSGEAFRRDGIKQPILIIPCGHCVRGCAPGRGRTRIGCRRPRGGRNSRVSVKRSWGSSQSRVEDTTYLSRCSRSTAVARRGGISDRRVDGRCNRRHRRSGEDLHGCGAGSRRRSRISRGSKSRGPGRRGRGGRVGCWGRGRHKEGATLLAPEVLHPWDVRASFEHQSKSREKGAQLAIHENVARPRRMILPRPRGRRNAVAEEKLRAVHATGASRLRMRWKSDAEANKGARGSEVQFKRGLQSREKSPARSRSPIAGSGEFIDPNFGGGDKKFGNRNHRVASRASSDCPPNMVSLKEFVARESPPDPP